MIDFSKPVQTRDGRKARVICTDRKYSLYPVIALIEGDNDIENVAVFTKNGHYLYDNGNHQKDLIQAPQHHKHHDVIIAWAKGAQVQYRDPEKLGNPWVDCIADPMWYKTFEYRVKPE